MSFTRRRGGVGTPDPVVADATRVAGTNTREGLRGLGLDDAMSRLSPKSDKAPTLEAIRGGAVIEQGMKGPAVGAVQDMLTHLGFPVARTETFGPTTAGLVREFQQLYGVQTTSKVGPTTLAALEGAVLASVSAAQLIEILPGADEAFITANLKYINQSMYAGDMTSATRKAAYLAQIAHESDRFRGLTEYASGSGYEGRADLGNTEPGDGKRFKGRGGIHLTGRANYQAASDHFGVDFVANPELVAEPEWAFKVAEWFWTRGDLNALADSGSFRTMTRRINGGLTGIDDREDLHARATEVLGG